MSNESKHKLYSQSSKTIAQNRGRNEWVKKYLVFVGIGSIFVFSLFSISNIGSIDHLKDQLTSI